MTYVGIDLGTTNSVICSYDGESVQLYKSPEQNDVTPSAIFIDKRGNRYVGTRAYNNAVGSPDNAAVLFKQLIGTSTPIRLPAVDVTMTPEQCSAEILRTLFGYLPAEIRNSDSTGTVVTVPAAFDQMQKDATMAATELAGMGKVALMQEPVAAVMSVMRQRPGDGIFLVYDLGGGTLDIAIAESIGGRVSLLANGGIAMCGGRQLDRVVFDSTIEPWLADNFALPPDWRSVPKYKALYWRATRAAETAKIELSQKERAIVVLPESEIGIKDDKGQEIYLEVPLDRNTFNGLMASVVDDSIGAAHETMEKAALRPRDIERIVFIGGPTQYAPLREKVAVALGVSPSTEVNPMTAVAEGAAVFAESIDWSSKSRGRKSAKGTVRADATEVAFNYTSRTPGSQARLVVRVNKVLPEGSEFQVDSLDTGWSSGRIPLKSDASLDLLLSKPGDNTFKIFLFDAVGGSLPLQDDKIVITRTLASVDGIPASHSIGIEVREKVGGRTVLDYLVREGDKLPVKGKKVFKAEQSLRSGTPNSLKFKLWEGEIATPISDNQLIGLLEIRGSDLDQTAIPAGSDLVCEYEILDSGNITMEVTVPSIGGSFGHGRNFYSRQEGLLDFSTVGKLIVEQSVRTMERLEEIERAADDPRLSEARSKLEEARNLQAEGAEPVDAKKGMERIQEAKKLIAQTRQGHLKAIRQLELDKIVKSFDETIRKYAKPSEASLFDNLVKTAQRSIESASGDFEVHIDELAGKSFWILWRQDWFVIDRFKWLAESSFMFPDTAEHQLLVSAGMEALAANDIDRLRPIVSKLDSARIGSIGEDDMFAETNILRG